MDVTLRIWFQGSHADAAALHQALKAESVEVTWAHASLAADAQNLAISLMAVGAYDGIKAAVATFRRQARGASVLVEVEVDSDDDERTMRVDEMSVAGLSRRSRQQGERIHKLSVDLGGVSGELEALRELVGDLRQRLDSLEGRLDGGETA